jgi:hypothetical protein
MSAELNGQKELINEMIQTQNTRLAKGKLQSLQGVISSFQLASVRFWPLLNWPVHVHLLKLVHCFQCPISNSLKLTIIKWKFGIALKRLVTSNFSSCVAYSAGYEDEVVLPIFVALICSFDLEFEKWSTERCVLLERTE